VSELFFKLKIIFESLNKPKNIKMEPPLEQQVLEKN
jgi:hypothetical protein